MAAVLETVARRHHESSVNLEQVFHLIFWRDNRKVGGEMILSRTDLTNLGVAWFPNKAAVWLTIEAKDCHAGMSSSGALDSLVTSG
jgi:hypothetical protein